MKQPKHWKFADQGLADLVILDAKQEMLDKIDFLYDEAHKLEAVVNRIHSKIAALYTEINKM
jgi:hypothetical protein